MKLPAGQLGRYCSAAHLHATTLEIVALRRGLRVQLGQHFEENDAERKQSRHSA